MSHRYTRPRRSSDSDSLYVIEAIGSDFAKVGFTTSIEHRIASLQTGCPFALRVAKVVDISSQCEERRFFDAIRHLHVRGEWFRPLEAVLASLARFLATSDPAMSEPDADPSRWSAECLHVSAAFLAEKGIFGRGFVRFDTHHLESAKELRSLLGIGAVIREAFNGKFTWYIARQQHIRALCEAIYDLMPKTRQEQIDGLLSAMPAKAALLSP